MLSLPGARRVTAGGRITHRDCNDGPVPEDSLPRAIPPAYDRDPDRFRLARFVLRRHALAPDVHARVARRFVADIADLQHI
jgi:hypothetical protein